MSDAHIPADAICAVDDCGHAFLSHKMYYGCVDCMQSHFFCNVDPCDHCGHEFEPLRLCGGALTPTQEREAYEKAKRGEL